MSNSDITYNTSVFDPNQIPEDTKALNNYLINHAHESGPQFWELPIQEFRTLQDQGKTSWPAPTFRLPHATYITIPSRDPDREIKCRLVLPQDGKAEGVFLYSHGGGHVLGQCDWSDALLSTISQSANLIVISPEYRLAPEHPFPLGNEDIIDVTEHLIDHSLQTYNCPLAFLGGESAGATLSMSTFLHLLDSRPGFRLRGLACMYGLFDWSLLPSIRTFTTPLIMTNEHVQQYGNLYLGEKTDEERRHPDISPLYHPLFQHSNERENQENPEEGEQKDAKLPPALFLLGIRDAVIDDNVLMSFRWQRAGGEAVVRFVEGAPHAFLGFPERFGMVGKGKAILTEFLKGKMDETV